MMLCLGTIGPDKLESHLHGPNLQKQEPKSIFTSLNCNFDLLFCLVSNIPGHVDSSVVELVHYAEHPFITLQKQMKETPNQKSTKKKNGRKQRKTIPLDLEVAWRWEKVQRRQAVVASIVGSYKVVPDHTGYTHHSRLIKSQESLLL